MFSTDRDTLATSLDAPPDVRPVRAVFCQVLPELTPDPKHHAVGLQWFEHDEHHARFESWLGEPDREVVVATEHVLRGADWLDERWGGGGERLKHMAIARRADGLTVAEFSERWRSRAGKVGTTPIPEEAKGLAYVQNHPVARADGEWPYDAVNEVYFDDVAGLRRRIVWFAETLGDRTEKDLVEESWFLAVREEVLS